MCYYEILSHFVMLDEMQIEDAAELELEVEHSLDLRFSTLLEHLRLHITPGAEIVENYLPNTLRDLDIARSALEVVDFSNCYNLESIDMFECLNTAVVRGYIPSSCVRLNLEGASCFVDLHGTQIRNLNVSGSKVTLADGFVPSCLNILTAAGGFSARLSLGHIEAMEILNISGSDDLEILDFPQSIDTLIIRRRTELIDLQNVKLVERIVGANSPLPLYRNYMPLCMEVNRFVSQPNVSKRFVEQHKKAEIQSYRRLEAIIYIETDVWEHILRIRRLERDISALDKELSSLLN